MSGSTTPQPRTHPADAVHLAIALKELGNRVLAIEQQLGMTALITPTMPSIVQLPPTPPATS